MPLRLLILPAVLAATAIAAPAPDFAFEVLPLLSDRCFRCHGPDSTGRKGDLRLDRKEELFKNSDHPSGRPVVKPGDRKSSELYQRLVHADPDELMPPPDSHLSLDAREIERIGRWIDAGAAWSPHWAFVPPADATPVPATKRADWARNEIDRFVLARLEELGADPSPEAPRETWLRRVTFDLTGLPPTDAELDAFAADGSPDAHAAVVDRLLASDAFAEHQAGLWLDLARYGDTFGYQGDFNNRMWPWRDWVIQAFRNRLPYDQFITWQLAGDLLPGATRDQILATGFNRLHRMTNEGGSVVEEFRVEYVAERVSTFGTAFLGLSFECARCHDHKYDPITQTDFYRLFAFFDDIDEHGLYSHFTAAVPTPTLALYEGDGEERHRKLIEAIAAAEAKLDSARQESAARFADWLGQAKPDGLAAAPTDHFRFDAAQGGPGPQANAVVPARKAHLGEAVPEQTAGGPALRFNGDSAAVLPGVADFGRTNAFSFSFWMQPAPEASGRQVVLHRCRAYDDAGSRGYEVQWEDGDLTWSLIHFWPGEAIRVKTRGAPVKSGPHRVAVTYDGSSRAAGLSVYVDGQLQEVEVVRDHLTLDIRHKKAWGDNSLDDVHLSLGARFRDSGFKDGRLGDLQVFDRALTPLEIRWLHGRGQPEPDLAAARAASSPSGDWLSLHAGRFDAAVAEARRALEAARAAEDAFITEVRRIMVMRELPAPKEARFLRRGQYDLPGEPVTAGAPEAMPPLPAGAPANRLGLARWLTDAGNPLAARVAVNRAWASCFGQGLVATPEDFGRQGEMPSHPQLLDWMARSFQRDGWDWGRLLKSIVLSSTYRQSSALRPDLVARDPQNRWLARGPRHRLSAEQIRDAALAASGLLVRTVGGESVKPYQPEGLWEESGTGKKYEQSKGDGLYRRSLYTFWRRTMPPASMSTFDAPSREFCKARREVTVTPLQALVLLNDPQYLEAARFLAAESWKTGAPPEVQVHTAFRRLLGRHPSPAELDALMRLRREQEAWYRERAGEATAFLAIGDHPAGRDLPAPELAAATVTVSAIMNLDEFQVKR